MDRIIVPAGYMGSGSTAITDILSEFDGIDVPNGDFEYVFLHCPNGLFDLEDKLLYGNNAVRCDEAIHSFLKCMQELYEKKHYWVGGYKEKVSESFDIICTKFINEICYYDPDAQWYYQENPDFSLLIKRVLIRILNKFLNGKFRNPYLYQGMHISYPTEEEFYSSARHFIESVVKAMQDGNRDIVFDQMLLPFNLFRIKNYFDERLRVIVVQRDPRDVFISNKYFWAPRNVAVPYAKNVDIFCEQYRRLMSMCRKCDDERVIYMNFEDLIYNYESSISTICQFVGINTSSHKRKKTSFIPEKSVNNTQLFTNEKFREEGKKIETELGEYLYNFGNKHLEAVKSEVF